MSKLVIDEQWHIEIDGHNCTLIFEEIRQRKRKLEIFPNTQETENYTFTESYYYPNVQACLRKYLAVSLHPCESIPEVLTRIDEVEKTIKNLKLCKKN